MAHRRRNGVNQNSYSQFAHPPEIAEPIHSTFISPSQTGYDSAWSTGNFVHTDPIIDNRHDTMMAPPPTSLSLSVPGSNSYNANTLLYSPSSDGYSQSLQDPLILPSYDGSQLGGGGDWEPKIDPSLYPSLSPTEKHRFNPFPEGEVKTKDLSASSQAAAMSNMNSKERTAHRKAIEEKSSMKRKLAEQRLSRAITSRLKGTFVPGLANQMNRAAELIERDAETIQALQAEVARLRSDVQMKFRD